MVLPSPTRQRGFFVAAFIVALTLRVRWPRCLTVEKHPGHLSAETQIVTGTVTTIIRAHVARDGTLHDTERLPQRSLTDVSGWDGLATSLADNDLFVFFYTRIFVQFYY